MNLFDFLRWCFSNFGRTCALLIFTYIVCWHIMATAGVICSTAIQIARKKS